MRSLTRAGLLILLGLSSAIALAQQPSNSQQPQSVEDPRLDQHIEELKEPLYSPFIERYLLDEIRSLRIDMERKHRELTEEVVDRELAAADKAVTYSSNTVTYFFYLIAGVSSALVLIGWSSIRDIKDKVHSVANEQVSELVEEYENRLRAIEKQLKQETAHIESNREEINRTQEIHSLWLRATQENSPAGKIAVYDQILAIRPNDVEAITYKADAALEQGEPQWAINLCHQALALDEHNGHAFYQLACSYARLGSTDEAARYFGKAVEQTEIYRDELWRDSELEPLRDHPTIHEILDPTIEKPS